jgi:hypothetical protein
VAASHADWPPPKFGLRTARSGVASCPRGGPAPIFEKSFSLPWSTLFEDPIPLPNGRWLLTLRDAANHITELPKAEHSAPEWQAAMQALILVAETGGGRCRQ